MVGPLTEEYVASVSVVEAADGGTGELGFVVAVAAADAPVEVSGAVAEGDGVVEAGLAGGLEARVDFVGGGGEEDG